MDKSSDKDEDVVEEKNSRQTAKTLLYVMGHLDIFVSFVFLEFVRYRTNRTTPYFMLQVPHAITGFLAILVSVCNVGELRVIGSVVFGLTALADFTGVLMRLYLIFACLFNDGDPECVEFLIAYVIDIFLLVLLLIVDGFEFFEALALRTSDDNASLVTTKTGHNQFLLTGALDFATSLVLFFYIMIPGVSSNIFLLQLAHVATVFASACIFRDEWTGLLGWGWIIYMTALCLDVVGLFYQIFRIDDCVVVLLTTRCAVRLYEHIVPFVLLVVLAALDLWCSFLCVSTRYDTRERLRSRKFF